MIVTTASLCTLRFQPADVALESGEFTGLDAKQIAEQIESIPWVRFHKTLSARYTGARTVFVVNAAALPDFLDEIAREQARLTARTSA